MVKQSNKLSFRGGMVTKRLGVLLITLTLLIVPIVFYYTVYISSRTSYLTNRDFRQLASISVQLEDRVEQLQGLFVKTVKRAITEKASQNIDSKSDSQMSPEELFKQRLGKNLDADIVPETKLPLKPEDVDKITKKLDSEISIKVVTGGETSTLYFIWSGSVEFPEGAKAKTRLDEIVTPFIGKRSLESRKGSEHEEGFDAILIASTEKKKNQSGETSVSSKIIFQQGTPDLDIDSLDNLANADISDKTIDVRTLTENSTSADVRLAGTTYKIYSQPIEIPLETTSSETANRSSKDNSSGNAETDWVVCGLVQTSHFQHEAWAFPYTWLIAFVFGTVVIILSWPFFKLQFIGPKDRLRLADFYWIGFSLLIGAAMLTFFLLYAVSYTRSEAVLDRQLEQTSLEISARFQEEVALILRELSALKESGRADLKQTETGKIKDNKWRHLPPVDGYKYPDDVQTEILKDEALQPDKESGVYPYFRSALWMNQDGERRREWTTYSSPLTPVSLTDRDYFKKIIEGSSRHNKVYEQLFSPGSAQYDFWLEPTTSRLTTEKVVVVSSSIKNETHDKDKVSIILLGDAAMMSLMRTIVPSGFGYRVIDSSGNDPSDDNWNDPGKVLFQSSESQQSKENFFQECDNNHSLRSLIFGHVAGFVDINYKGESHRIFVRPVDGFPNWSLIVFRNKQPLRTVFLQILTTAGFLFFVYAILLLLPLTIAYVFRIRKNNRTEWIWPTPLKADVYRKTKYAYLLLCALSLAVMLGLLRFLGIDADRWTPMVLVSLLAFTGVLVLALRPSLNWPLGKLHSIVNTLKLNRLLDRGNSYVWKYRNAAGTAGSITCHHLL